MSLRHAALELEDWTVIVQRRQQEQPLTDRNYPNDKMTFNVQLMVT